MSKENKFRICLKIILELPYYKNYSAASGCPNNVANHEQAVMNVLENNGFLKRDLKVSKSDRDKWLDNPELSSLEDGCFIYQPCGSQESPDFIIRDFNSNLFFVECKSAKGGTPMYNSALPKDKYIYILTSEKYNSNTIFLGSDVLTQQTRVDIEQYEKEADELAEKFNKLLKKDQNRFGISLYPRLMIQHTGGIKAGNDYFINPDRKIIEEKVLEYCDAQF